MDVSVRELRNHTGRVIAAVEGGEPVVLTVHGRPVADIIPRRLRSERRPSDLLLADLAAIDRLAAELDITSDARRLRRWADDRRHRRVTRGYLADTSVFVAAEQRRAPGRPPDGDARISVATLTELIVGVRRAADGPLRTLREATLARARTFVALPYDEAVAERLADLLSAARAAGRRGVRWTRSLPLLRLRMISSSGPRTGISTCSPNWRQRCACTGTDRSHPSRPSPPQRTCADDRVSQRRIGRSARAGLSEGGGE